MLPQRSVKPLWSAFQHFSQSAFGSFAEMRERQSVVDTLPFALAAEEMVCGGQSREGCALDLGLPEGVTAEEQRRVIGSGEARFGVGVRDPAVAPARQGGLDDGGREVGVEMVVGEADHGIYDLCLVVLEVRAAPFRPRVDRDGWGFGDALSPVVADPVQRLPLDLHSPGLRYAGWIIEQDQESETRVVSDDFELVPGLIRQPVAAR